MAGSKPLHVRQFTLKEPAIFFKFIIMINTIIVIVLCSVGLLVDLLRMVSLIFQPRWMDRHKFLTPSGLTKLDLMLYFLAMMVLLVSVIFMQLGYGFNR
jgi:hypothetical protein